MGLLVALIASFICAFFYVRMYKREVPEPIGKKKAALPIALGLVSPFLSTLLVVLFGFIVLRVTGGKPLKEVIGSPVLHSFVSSFILAGFTEEFIKFLMFLLTVVIVKPKNVYEYGLLCAGVGLGFTALEDVIYGGGNVAVAVSRTLFFGMHMSMGLIMGTYFGLFKYDRKQGNGSAGLHLFLALFLPLLWHTLFDAATATNVGIETENETLQVFGIVYGLITVAVSVVLQFVVLSRFKKKTEEYCAMET